MESKDPVRYGVIVTLIFSKGGEYSVTQLLVFEVGKNLRVVLGHFLIVKDCTEHVTGGVSETIDGCVQKVVKGILRQQWHRVLFTVLLFEEYTGARVGI